MARRVASLACVHGPEGNGGYQSVAGCRRFDDDLAAVTYEDESGSRQAHSAYLAIKRARGGVNLMRGCPSGHLITQDRTARRFHAAVNE